MWVTHCWTAFYTSKKHIRRALRPRLGRLRGLTVPVTPDEQCPMQDHVCLSEASWLFPHSFLLACKKKKQTQTNKQANKNHCKDAWWCFLNQVGVTPFDFRGHSYTYLHRPSPSCLVAYGVSDKSSAWWESPSAALREETASLVTCFHRFLSWGS